jgi:CheY-like chemotaxis protein
MTPSGDGFRILVIDDESNIRMMVRLALRHVGHTVETASDGAEGLEKFGDGAEWDLILLDHRMPGLTGLEVLREMRRRDPDARVIVITAFGTIDLATEAMQAGATDFLRKPFTADMLRDTVNAALAAPAPSNTGAPGYEAGINGFRIEAQTGTGTAGLGEVRWSFSVRDPRGEARDCAVLLPAPVVERVKAHARPERMPDIFDQHLFWQSLCEEALANYVWQNAEFPPDHLLRVDELTAGMRRRVDAAVGAA